MQDRRDRRESVLSRAAERAAEALRWYAGDDKSRAHRRETVPAPRVDDPRALGSRAACGAGSSLTLAAATVPLCPRCYPPAGS